MRHYLSLITVAVLHVSAKWRTAHHLTKGKSRMFELITDLWLLYAVKLFSLETREVPKET